MAAAHPAKRPSADEVSKSKRPILHLSAQIRTSVGKTAPSGHLARLPNKSAPTIVWFREDLRLSDQAAYSAAALEGPVLAVFVLDDEAAGGWRMGGAQRWWLHHSLASLGARLKAKGVPLVLRRGRAATVVAKLASEIGAKRVHCLTHYEPWWREAEEELSTAVELVRHGGHLLADPRQIQTSLGGLYKIFTPYWRALWAQMPPPEPMPEPASVSGFVDPPRGETLANWDLLPAKPNWACGFSQWAPGEDGANRMLRRFVGRVRDYDYARNFPSIEGSSHLSPHLHFGEISPAAVWHALAGQPGSEQFLRQIGWRDFASNLILQFPAYADENGRSEAQIRWRSGDQADADFRAWCSGKTGYPIVDAGMRQLWHTGWMHNRVRMITASFLVKHLLIDWRRGERWFWDCLVDADYANNSVNWQWISSTGVDSSPFGRIMAPLTQSVKFDAAEYIRRWVPELADLDDRTIHDPHAVGAAPPLYPPMLIEHREARERALSALGARR